jgi:hypothetical protein
MTLAKEANTRAPRGTKILAQAFLAAAGEIPELQRDSVVKAALALIRDKLKETRAKAKIDKQKHSGKASAANSQAVGTLGRPKGSKHIAKKILAEPKNAVASKKIQKKPLESKTSASTA